MLSVLGTGTGKTLSFVLPILERMLAEESVRSERGRPPCTLVMAPTRELANQVRAPLISCNECLCMFMKIPCNFWRSDCLGCVVLLCLLFV